MAYNPNAHDKTEPTEDRFVESAAAEFREIKDKLWDAIDDIQGEIDNIVGSNTPLSSSAIAELFDGDDVKTSFPLLRNPGKLANLDVSISGVTQRPGIDYVWVNPPGTMLDFVVAPITGVKNILVRYTEGLPEDSDGSIRNDLGSTELTLGDALVTVVQPVAGAVARTQHQKNADVLSLLDFLGGGTDDTVQFQNAINSHKKIWVPQGNYTIGTVNVDVYGCDLEFDKQAVVNVTGEGFKRNLLQTPRATFVAANPLLDATNYYFGMRIRGGTFNVGVGATAISDRVPFLVSTTGGPPGIFVLRSLVVEDSVIMLNDATSKGIGIHGGWGSTVRSVTLTGNATDAIAIDIGGSAADGDTHCHPQEIMIDNVTINSCRAFASAKNGCTNSAEGLTVRGSWLNFVRRSELIEVNSVRWIAGNLLVTDNHSLDITDCGDVAVDSCYFESNHDPANASLPGILNFQNCQPIRVQGCAFNVASTPVAVARAGIFINTNAVNGINGVAVLDCKFQHGAINMAIETSAIAFGVAGGVGQQVNIVLRNINCNDWHNAINFESHLFNLATWVTIENISNLNGVRLLKGLSRIALNSLRAPNIWERFTLVLSGVSQGGGVANLISSFWPFITFGSLPIVTVTNFVNHTHCAGVTAQYGAVGANSVHIICQQDAASVLGQAVQGQGTITIDGTAA